MSALILALNPSIDAEWRVADVHWEEKNNVQSERRWAGGKGINVARWLKYLGDKPRLVLPLGGLTGAELASHLRAEKIIPTIVRLREPTRVNIIVTTESGRQMRFNPAGPRIAKSEWSAILELVRKQLMRTKLLVLSGSLPRGLPVAAYTELISLANYSGVKTLLDCDGPAFASAVKARPFLVKPNEHELSQWRGQALRSSAEIVRAARDLSKVTRGWVLVSRGGKRSLLLNVRESFEQFAVPPKVKPRNTVGAGDALLAAVVWQIQLGKAPAEWLSPGLAIGTQATQLPAGELPQ